MPVSNRTEPTRDEGQQELSVSAEAREESAGLGCGLLPHGRGLLPHGRSRWAAATRPQHPALTRVPGTGSTAFLKITSLLNGNVGLRAIL